MRTAHPDSTAGTRFVVSTFESLTLEPQAYDLVVASMSLHHFEDKAPFYRQLWDALAPGGALVFAEELNGAVPYVQQLHWNDWMRFWRRTSIGKTPKRI